MNEEIKVRPFFIKCISAEIIAVILVLITVLSVKFISPKEFNKLKEWYKVNFLDETSVNEVLKDGTKYEV